MIEEKYIVEVFTNKFYVTDKNTLRFIAICERKEDAERIAKILNENNGAKINSDILKNQEWR